ncbi:MAG: ParB/RepB/Spo0J family partition protein [Deltaproteobacteria bacterium]|nr:ParB/RepB/Spo0J family partition protein [Deltaproteobacteria bacterium]
MIKRKALGRGLSALIPDAEETEKEVFKASEYFQCPVDAIEPNPMQPRQNFDDAAIEELAGSIREKGVITPILVSKNGDGYQLIAGERRWRAAQRAGLETVPVVVKETTPIESLELALIENIHRRDLNPIEEAQAYQRWLENSNTTQEILAQRVGKDRSTITNLLRLLSLPLDVQKDVIDGNLTMGHARVLAGLKTPGEQKSYRDIIIKGELSVRQTENLIKKGASKKPVKKEKGEDEYYIDTLADGLKRALGTKVEIKRQGKKGQINIFFHSDEELERLLEHLS